MVVLRLRSLLLLPGGEDDDDDGDAAAAAADVDVRSGVLLGVMLADVAAGGIVGVASGPCVRAVTVAMPAPAALAAAAVRLLESAAAAAIAGLSS